MPESNETGLLLKYFVLSPAKQDPYGEASRTAARAYAAAIEATNPVLAAELVAWMNMIEEAAGD